jgi:hypothetical protein
MPIRKRGESWQIDIRTADGMRLRRSYPSQTEALEAEALLKPNPQQRAAMRELRRKSSARSKLPAASEARSSNTVPISIPERLERATSRLSALTSTKSARTPTTEKTSTPNSGGYSGPSGPGFPVSPESRK